jgi:hypothetical protein
LLTRKHRIDSRADDGTEPNHPDSKDKQQFESELLAFRENVGYTVVYTLSIGVTRCGGCIRGSTYLRRQKFQRESSEDTNRPEISRSRSDNQNEIYTS